LQDEKNFKPQNPRLRLKNSDSFNAINRRGVITPSPAFLVQVCSVYLQKERDKQWLGRKKVG
jgi:hypothetical protein